MSKGEWFVQVIKIILGVVVGGYVIHLLQIIAYGK